MSDTQDVEALVARLEARARTAPTRFHWSVTELTEAATALRTLARERDAARADAKDHDRAEIGWAEAKERASSLEAQLAGASAGVGRRVRHKVRGTTYEVLGIGKMQSEGWADGEYGCRSVDMADVVVYRSEADSSIWVRPQTEFEDGRFEDLTPSEGRDGKEVA